MDVNIEESWKSVLSEEFEKDYFQSLTKFVRDEYQEFKIYPPAKQIFSAFDHCSFEEVKVVIIGQDPYHGEGQANGLCFSVAEGVKPPPSLVNIFKEIELDLGIKVYPNHSEGIINDLITWNKSKKIVVNSTAFLIGKHSSDNEAKSISLIDC